MKKAPGEKKSVIRSNFLGRFGRWWTNYFRVLLDVFRASLNDNVNIMASGLVYSTLIALVPMITFLIVFLSSFGVLQNFLDLMHVWLEDTFGAATAQEIVEMVSHYSTNALSLGVFGIVSFLITGMFLVNKIYLVINNIFRTKLLAAWVKRFFIFLVFLIAFSFLIALAFALENTITLRLQRAITDGEVRGDFIDVLKKIGAYIIFWLIFFLMLLFVPNTKVRASSATIGATTGLVAMLITNLIFSWVIGMMVKYWTIYGTLASLFFILLYFYIIWYIVIVVSELTYIHQFKPDRNTLLGRPQHPIRTIGEAINMLVYVGRRFKKGSGPSSMRVMTKDLKIPSARLNVYVSDLMASSILLPTNTQKTNFVIARPADQIYLREVIEVIYGSEEDLSDHLKSIGDEIARDFYYRGTIAFDDIRLSDLIDRSEEIEKRLEEEDRML